MTHFTRAEPAPQTDWERWLTEAGIDYVEVARCPQAACRVCHADPEVSAAA